MSVAVVTGAGSGLGASFARRAAADGLAVVVADVDATRAAGISDAIVLDGGRAIPVTCDVADPGSVAALARTTLDVFGTPSLVINNAGVASPNGLLWEAEAADWSWVFGVNVHGVANGVRSFVPVMLDQAARDPAFTGRIVNVASMGGLFSPTLCGVYAASKHAVVALSEVLYHDLTLVTDQVRCSIVCPWFVPTQIGEAERTRPAALGRTRARTRSETVGARFAIDGMRNARLDSGQVADIVFEAIARDDFYILTHPAMVRSVEMRMRDIVDGTAPREPFSFRPELARTLRAALLD